MLPAFQALVKVGAVLMGFYPGSDFLLDSCYVIMTMVLKFFCLEMNVQLMFSLSAIKSRKALLSKTRYKTQQK